MSLLKIASFSDLHKGHKRNDTKKMIENFKLALPDNQETSELDIIILAGDVFDRLLQLNSEHIPSIISWIFWLFDLCNKYSITLIVTEGTPSHDWKQSILFKSIYENNKRNYNFDFRYIDKLSIEYVDKFKINILVIPDEWDVSTDKTLQQVKDAIAAKGLDKVDFAIMHGNFDYQLPSHIQKIPRHNSDEYLKIVKHYIFIGHIHKHSCLDRIIAQGSFDRLSHNEEEPKGHIRAFVNLKNNKREFFFIENKNARIYKKIQVYEMPIENSLEYIFNKVKDLPLDACVSIEAEPTNNIFSNMKELFIRFPTLTWTKNPKELKSKKEETNEVVEDLNDYDSVTITQQNIVDILMQRIQTKQISVDFQLTQKTLEGIVNV